MVPVKEKDMKPVGYKAVERVLSIETVLHFRYSYLSEKGQRKTLIEDGQELHIYPSQYNPGESVIDQLVFALKYDGVNLEILKAVFEKLGPGAVKHYVKSHPVSKYARVLWYLYEFLTGESLKLPDVSAGNYVEILDKEIYFTDYPLRSRRHRVVDNMLGVRDFCPTVRKTDKLQVFILKDLSDKAKKLIAKYPAEVVRKAAQYLYTKETLTSFDIEREKPSPKRAAKFINMLQNAAMTQKLGKELLIEVQNAVVDERFAMSGYRITQNYIGESVGTRRIVHYVAPLHEDVGGMMSGLFESSRRMSGIVDPVVYAAAVSFALVYIHPFDDGNGRVHRYVIHHILKQEGFTPEGTIFPVSATMLANLQNYDKCLETFSKKIMSLLDFTIDERGEITVKNKTADHYRYMDLTHAAEYLYETVERTIKKEFVEELDFLVQRSHAVKAMMDVADMPDKLIDLFIKIALEQNGHISKAKKKSVFHMLNDSEIDELEKIVRNSFKRPHAMQKL